ncbi:MAG: cytochrome c [Gammaproteobacteria bacterium]|nr:cytochrome c [Gammaproteobacteria bacterium]
MLNKCLVGGLWFFFIAASPLLAQEINLERQQQLTHIVKQDCGSCHGMTLKGGLGTPLLPEDLANKSIEFLSYTIINGRPTTAMPPWREILTEQEATWIAQQLKLGSFNDK